jgi:hypothetical protein
MKSYKNGVTNLKRNKMDFIKTYIKYVLFHRWNKLSEESINLIEQHWKNKPTNGMKLWLYKKIIKIKNRKS